VTAAWKGPHGRSFEARSGPADDGWLLQVQDLPDLLGEERASFLRLTCPSGLPAAELARFAQWCVTSLPLWWGTAGPLFHLGQGRTDVAWYTMARLAKRYWCVQLMDTPAMQWDAVRGLHGIGWLTMVGHELAATASIDLAGLPETHSSQVFVRSGDFATVLAAGAAPLRGDVNRGEALGPYVAVNEILARLQIDEGLPWPGPFAAAGLRSAWMRRFRDPDGWLAASLD
jgi:hypothetical protein